MGSVTIVRMNPDRPEFVTNIQIERLFWTNTADSSARIAGSYG